MAKPSDYIWIRAWGAMMGSFPYYVEMEQQIAADQNAPITATYRKGGSASVSSWATLEDVISDNTRDYLASWADRNRVGLPGSVVTKWIEDNNKRRAETQYALDDCINYKSNPLGDCGGRVETVNGVRVCENCRNKENRS